MKGSWAWALGLGKEWELGEGVSLSNSRHRKCPSIAVGPATRLPQGDWLTLTSGLLSILQGVSTE